MLQGLMMHSPLLITSIMRFAERNHASPANCIGDSR